MHSNKSHNNSTKWAANFKLKYIKVTGNDNNITMTSKTEMSKIVVNKKHETPFTTRVKTTSPWTITPSKQ